MIKIIFHVFAFYILLLNCILPASASEDANSIVKKAIELTLKEGSWVDGRNLNYTAKTWLKNKRPHKAVAFCTDWNSQVPKVLAGAKHFELMGLGFGFGKTRKKDAINNALNWCNKTHDELYKDYECQCEHIWTNKEFLFSDRLNKIITTASLQKNKPTSEADADAPTAADTNMKVENDSDSRSPGQIKNHARPKFEQAKSICSEIGLKFGTEDFGKCVLKMMDN